MTDKDPDPGRLNYTIHNIYLNFIETYGRLPPAKPITIHQKALFTFWMSCVTFWLLIQLIKLYTLVRKSTDGDENDNNDTMEPDDPTKEVNIDLNTLNHPPGKYSDVTEITVNATCHDAQSVEAKLVDDMKPEGPTKKQNLLLERTVKTFCEIFSATDEKQPSLEAFLAKMMLFGCILFYIWLCDYLHMWPKIEKQYSRDMFVFLFFLLVFVSFVFTVKKTKDKLLNRDQTEEWKGWMQVQFVWYHYYDAQETFNSIRCYVGAYVWMTGFGNYIYFSTRKDYSILRLLEMLFRLNFLVFCIMGVSNHEFVRYYICAMHTYWFLSVWAVMVVLNRYNDNQKFVLLKFAIYFAINAIIFDVPGVSWKVFTPFLWALHDADGTLRYWIYRAMLDHWSTIVGMFIALNFERFENLFNYLDEDNPQTKIKREIIRYSITAVLLSVFVAWFYYILLLPKHMYMGLHPYTSPIPIVIYTWLRNMHPVLRTHYLGVFAWLGKITLETYLAQIHIYMMGNAKTLVVYLPGYPMLNFAVSTLIYIGVSYVLFHLTVFFRSYIFPRNGKVVIKNIILGSIWLGCCYIIGFVLTTLHIWGTEKSGLEFLRWKIKKYN